MGFDHPHADGCRGLLLTDGVHSLDPTTSLSSRLHFLGFTSKAPSYSALFSKVYHTQLLFIIKILTSTVLEGAGMAPDAIKAPAHLRISFYVFRLKKKIKLH